jgi:uracil phosphoribosyltransferase
MKYETHAKFSNLTVIDHPLAVSKLTILRDKTTPSPMFAQTLKEISYLLAFAATSQLPTESKTIETPLCEATMPVLKGDAPVLVPILRAGLAMMDGVQTILPQSPVGHIGVYRDHDTHEPKEYVVRLPDVKNRPIIVVDPMLATGHSALYAIDVLVKHGADPKQIVFMSLLAAPEGVAEFLKRYPMTPIYTVSLDSHLNENAYIVPGLGDAGDRTFGTL